MYNTYKIPGDSRASSRGRTQQTFTCKGHARACKGKLRVQKNHLSGNRQSRAIILNDQC